MAQDNGGQGYARSDICRRCVQGGLVAPGRATGLAAPAQAQATPVPSYLLRIEKNSWFILADSNTAPTLLVPGLDAYRMVVSADGQEGWVAGKITRAGQPDAPALFRLHQGNWGLASALLAPDYIPIDLAYSADGKVGWLTARNAAGQVKLWSLSNGEWTAAQAPAGATLTYIGVGPGGQEAWAVDSSGATVQTYHLSGGTWSARGLASVPAGYTPSRVTADDSGNGWLLVQAGEANAHTGVLIRLPAQGAPSAANLTSVKASAGSPLGLTELAGDGAGQGWAVGYSMEGGTPQPVLLRVSGDNLTTFTAGQFNLPADFTLDLTSVSVSPNGGSAWVGNADGHLVPLAAGTSPGMPRTGAGADGAGLGLLFGLLFALAGLLLLHTRRVTEQTGV
jgi:hypothetical protein